MLGKVFQIGTGYPGLRGQSGAEWELRVNCCVGRCVLIQGTTCGGLIATNGLRHCCCHIFWCDLVWEMVLSKDIFLHRIFK